MPLRSRVPSFRRIGIGLIASAVVVLMLVGVAHTPPGRAYALHALTDYLRGVGIESRASGLGYNLFLLRAELRGLELAAAGTPDEPFFTATRATMDLPWRAIFRGAVAFQSLELFSPRVSVHRRADRSFNLPELARGDVVAPSSPARPVVVGRLLIEDLSALYVDRSRGTSIELAGLSLDLEPEQAFGSVASGTFSAHGGLSVRAGDQATTTQRLDGRIAFDGATLAVDDLVLEMPEGRVDAHGRVDLLAAHPAVDLTLNGEINVDAAARWVPVDPIPGGRLSFSGRATGARGDPGLALQLSSDDLAWHGLENVSLRVSGSGGFSGVRVETLALGGAGGSITGTAALRIGTDGAIHSGDTSLEWRDLDLAAIKEAFAHEMPIRVGALVDGSLEAALTGTDLSALSASARLISREVASSEAMPVSGHAELALDDGVWSLALDHRLGSIRVAGTGRGLLNARALTTTTLGGQLAITADDLSRAVRDLRRGGIDLPAGPAETLRGRLAAHASIGGTLSAPVAEIALNVADLTAGVMGPAALSAHGVVTADRGDLTGFELVAGPNRAQGSATVGHDGELEGRVSVDAPELNRLLAGVPAALRPYGSLSIDVALSGTTSQPRTTGTVEGAAMRVAGQQIERVSSTFGSTGSVFVIDDVTLTQAEGYLSARGRYDLSTGRYSVRIDGQDWEVRPIPGATAAGSDVPRGEDTASGVPVAGRFSARLEGAGTVRAPSGDGELTFADVRFGDYPVGAGRVEVALAEGRASFDGSLSGLSTSIRGSVGLTAPYPFAGALQIDRAELSRLAGAAPVDGSASRTLTSALTGALSLSVEMVGRLNHLDETEADLRIELVEAAIGETPIVLDRPVALQYRREYLMADEVGMRIGGSRFVLTGRLGAEVPDDELRASFDGRFEDVLALARVMAPDADVSGRGSLSVHVTASGSLAAPSVSARISSAVDALTYRDLPPVTALVVDGVYSDGVLRLTRANAGWQGASIEARADVPAALLAEYLPASYLTRLPPVPGPARLTARIDSVTREILAPFLDEAVLARIDAHVSGRLDLEAARLDPLSVTGRVELDQGDFVVAGVPLRQLEPSVFTLRAGDVRVDAFRWGGEGNELVMSGDVALGSAPAGLNLDLKGMLNLRILSAFVPDVATSGTARVGLVARGTPADPDINGQVALESVDITIREPRVAITDLAGVIHVTGDRATASALSGSANGGTVSVGGVLAFAGLAAGEGRLTLEGRRWAIELANGARAEVNADLTLALSASDDPVLSGRLAVLRGAYREPISLTDLAFGGDATGVETVGLDEEGFADRIRLDVALVTADDVRVDNNYGRAELGANLRVLGTISQPALGGRATIREGGQVFLGGNTYIIEQGAIEFIDPARIAPAVDLRARTRIGGYGVTLAVSGALDALEHDLQSDPPLPESDIVSLLVTGRTLSEAGGAQTDVARDQVLGYISGDLLGFAGRAVGLDTVRFERGLSADTLPTDLALFAGDEDPASRLTISKNVRRDVEIVLSQNLRQSGGLTWIAMYRPLAAIELRTISRDDNSRAYEFRHTLQFGGGVRSGGAGGPDERRPPPRVAVVQFAGRPGFDVDRLRATLNLAPGDRFDFFTWQRDREALESFYHAHEYLEARIGAAREPPGETAGPVTLVYTVERGPHTTLRVVGHALPGGLLDRLREAWGDAVFDGFLLDDMREVIRRHLIGEGYLFPVIEPEVIRPGPDEKQIVVQVQAGARSRDRAVEFVGNDLMPVDRLMGALEPLEVEQVAWTDPEAVAAGVERFYRSEGFLAADVTAHSPVLDGGRARLPVLIEEGPRFLLAHVAIEGASTLGDTTVKAIADLRERTTYSAAASDEARMRIEREYRRLGFNRARVTATANVDVPNAAVTLVLAIAEGSRQVLAGISISGADATRPQVVTDALALQTGDAVDLTAWYQARRRLYDTNVFRSVELEVEPMAESLTLEGEEPVRARVTLEEWPKYRFRYGFQLNDEVSPVAERGRELSPGLVADGQNRNVLGRASTAGIAVRFQDDFRIARAFLGTPTVFGLKIRSGVFFTRSRQDFNQEGVTPFIEDTAGVSVEQRLRPYPAVEVAYSYRLENKRTFTPDPNPFDPFPLDLRVRIGRFAVSLVAEHRDDPFDATRGWFHSSTVEYSPELFGSELRFAKYLGQAYYFRPVGPEDRPIVFASAARVGAGRGFGQDLIVSEKFFVGGANSVRGYPEDSLGELDFFGDPVGGNGLVLFNQEMRFPIFRWVRGVAFVDAGSVFSRAADLSLSDLQAGVGLGLRIQTPFALVRIDHATALSPRPGEPPNRWYFSIGQAF